MKISLRLRVGRRVKELRLATGHSQESLADICGFARSYMSRVERGVANLSLDALERLAEALGVAEGELFAFPAEEGKGSIRSVPYAADGTCFHPNLASSRDGTFKVGEPDAPTRFAKFDDALAHLASMDTAKWWRPNSSGNPTMVSAVRWKRIDLNLPPATET